MPSLMCEHPELQSFLEGKIPPGEEQPWLDHLESCPKCQARIEEMAADRNWWQDARTFLSTDSGIAAVATPVETAAESEEAGHEPISLDFLAPTDDPESLGRLGTYEVTGVIGRGGSGIVLKAFDRSLSRNVAIKVLSPHLATSGAARKRFAREGQAAAAVVHEHVIPIFAVAAHQNLPYIVMQYFPGRSLQQRLDRDGPLELREILRIGLQTARGLAAAHAQGLIHRDVKPANILLADGIERVTLSDFGLARALDDARLTRTGWLAGTPEYMSPEQSRGKGMDARSDLFSLGSVLYTTSTGRVPFQAETSYGTLRQVTDDEPAPIRQLNADIPEWLCGLIAKLMAKAPENRFGSAEEVANLLEACLAHVQQPEATALPESLIVKKPKPDRKSFFGGRTVATVLLGLAGFFVCAFALWQITSPPDIAGWWTGEDWGKVQLKHLGTGEYEGTYTDTFGKSSGTIHLNWSRIERRFFGTWREGEERFGELSIRLVKDEIRGALTTDAKSKINPATPRLADLLWVKEGNQKDSGSKIAKNTIQARLQGHWQVTWISDRMSGVREYVPTTEARWIFSENRLTFFLNDKENGAKLTFELINDENPFLIDLVNGNASARCVGIVEENKIRFCMGTVYRPAKKAEPTDGLKYFELARLVDAPAAKPTIENTGALQDQGVRSLVQKGDRTAIARERAIALENAREKEVKHDQELKLQSAIRGTWIPSVHNDGLFKIREFQAEFPPPVWRIEIDRIIFETNPKIEAAVEVLEAKVPALLQLTYANQAKQFLRIDSQNSKLLIASSTKRAPEKAVPASDCEYWELKKVVDPLVDRNWAIKVDARDSDLKSQATLPPSKDLLFPQQPLPKVPAPNLVFAWKEGEQNRQDLKPMSRVYGKQEWAGYIKGVTIKLTWSYLGRTVTKVGPDAEIYEINATESIKGVDQKTWNKKVTFNGQPVKVFENEGFSITMAPSQMPAYPAKAANEYPGMAAMLQKITASQSMIYHKHIKSSFLNENIGIGIKIRNQCFVTDRSDSGKKQEASYYDTIRNVALTIDYKSKEASYRKIDGNVRANLDVRCKLSALGELPSSENSNEIMDGVLCRKYTIYDVLHKNRKASEIILWINQLTNMPLKMVESVTGDSDREITTTWPDQADLPEVLEESVAMPGFSGAKNYALYADIYGSKSKSQSDSSSPPTSGPAAIEVDERHKTRILDQLQGNWVTVKKALGDGKDRLGHDAEVWLISGNKIRFGSSEMFSYDIKIIEGSNPVKVDLILNVNKDEDKIIQGKIADKGLIKLEENKIVLCQSVNGSRPSKLGYGDGWVYYELVRIPKPAETASGTPVEAPKVQNELFKQVPYLDRLFAKPNRESNANNPPWEEYRLNRGPRLICHQGPIETNGYFGIHLARRVEDRVVTCNFGGTSYRMYWKFLGRVPFPAGEAGDVYEIKRRAPANADNPVLSSRIVVYRGSRVKVFDDGNPSVIIEAPDFQDPAPEIADGKQAVAAMIKKLEDIRSLECQLTIAERDQPEKTLQYYRRGDQVCLEEPEKRRMIWDFKSNRFMNLDLAKRTATMFDLNQPSLASEGQRRDAIDFLTVLRSLAGHPANYELTEKVQGLYCDLYHVVPAKAAAGPWALWLNQTTHLPSALQGCLAQNTGTYYFNEIRWNPNLKDSLFTMEIPAGFMATGMGDSRKAPDGAPKDGASSQGSLTKSHAAKLPAIRIRAGSGPFAQIIERPLEGGNVLTNYKLGNPGMEWEVNCQATGKRTLDCGPSPEVFELQWKFMGDNRLPAQKTGSQTAFLIGKATKAVDEPDFGIELIPSETDARITGASGAKTSFVETIGKISGISTAILTAKYKRDDNKTANNVTYIKENKSVKINSENGTKTIASIDNGSKKNLRINDSLKIASIDKSENNRHGVWDDISLLKDRLSSWDHEYIYSETVHNKTCDLYRIWPGGPSTIPYNHLSFIWIDQATKLPVLSSSVSSSGGDSLTEFQWDRSLSDSLFSLEIPKGYSLISYEEFMKQSVPGWVEKIKRSARGAGVSSDPMTSDKQGILVKLQGCWKPVLAYRGLTKLSDESARREFALEISKDRLEFVSESDGSRSWMTIELNNDENPFQMDLVREHVSARCVGIVEGNKLRLCRGAAFRQAKEAEPTEGLEYAEYERTDHLPYEEPKTPTTFTADRGATRWNDPVRYPLMRVLEAYQGEWTVVRHVDENLHALDVSQTVKPDEPWIVFGESFTVAGMPADHIQATFTVPGKPMKIELMFKSPPGRVDDSTKQKTVRIPSIWSVEGERLRVILGREGNVPEKLEPTQGFKYFELTRAGRKPKPSSPATSADTSETKAEKAEIPKGTGPNLIILQSGPGVAGRTVEPVGQDSRQMVRIVGNGADQTEIRWSYQGKLSFEPNFEVPVYEFQWKYLGTQSPGLQREGSKTVYFQGLPIKIAEFSAIRFIVESAQNDSRLTGGGQAKTSFEDMIERISQAKSCILDEEIFRKTDKISVSNNYWIRNRSIRFCIQYGFQVTIKDDRELNKRVTLLNSKRLIKEQVVEAGEKIYQGEIQSYCKFYGNRKAKFLYTEKVGSKGCDVYQVLPNHDDKEMGDSQILFWIEHGTNLPLFLRSTGFLGNYTTVQFQWNIPVDESAFSTGVPPGFTLDKKGQIFREQSRYLDRSERGIKIGVPLPSVENFQADKKTKAAQVQGTWLVVKKINEAYRDEKIVDPKKQTWTIRGKELTIGGETTQQARIEIVDTWPIFHVDLTPKPVLPDGLGFPLKPGGRIPSLWSLEGDLLRVAIGEEGHVPMKLEPAAGVRYFELVRFNGADPSMDPGASALEPQELKALKARIGSFVAGANGASPAPDPQGAPSGASPSAEHLISSLPMRTESTKQRIIAALEGEWVTNMEVVQDAKGANESGKPGITWTIRGDSFVTDLNPDQPARMVVVDTNGPIRIEFLLPVSLPRSDGAPSLRIIRVPSLWTLRGNQLKVAIGTEGQKLDRLEPAPGVKYFELVRKPAQSNSDQASPQNPAASHWLFPWAVANGPKPEVTTDKANPTFNLPSSNPDHLPQASATRASTVVTEIKKDEILSQISGRWVVSKQSRWNRMTGEVAETTGDVWEITGKKLTSLSRFDSSVELEVMATEPHLQIDWIYPGPNRLLRAPFHPEGGRVASLWAIEKGKLKVVILEGGSYPEKLEPSLGCIYFELIPKEPAIPNAGFPAEIQGQWKLTKTIGIDLREESFNRDAMVTIARNQLQIGKEVKKAELVQSGNPFRMNLIAPMPMAAEEVRVPSLWELKGDRLCFNSGKELPAKVGPSPGIYYFELTRVVEPKQSNPGEPGNRSKAGTASLRQGDSGPAADAAKAASFQQMVGRLRNAQSASFEMTYANQTGLPQFSATAQYLIRGKQVRIDQMIEGAVLVTRIVDLALKKGVLINHNNKTAIIMDFSKSGENIRRTPMDMNFLRVCLEGFSPDKDGSQGRRSEVKIFYLRTESLEGKACDVHRVFPSQADDENMGGPWIVWVDSQSHDLVSIRGQARSETFTLSHFQWNLSLEDSPFKLDVPQGFQITDNWIDAWTAKLEALRPLPARKMEPPQKRNANKTAAPAGAASKQPVPQLHPMQ